MQTFGHGVLNLMLAPAMIVAGIAQGIAFLPYTIGMGLGDLNRALLQANAVSLDDSYKATFGVSVNDRQVHQNTGDVYGQDGLYGRYKPEALFEANRAFHLLLASQGMPQETAAKYVLVGNYTHAWSRGQILLAVVRCHAVPRRGQANEHTDDVPSRPARLVRAVRTRRRRTAGRRSPRLGGDGLRASAPGQARCDTDGSGRRGGQSGPARPRLLDGRATLARGGHRGGDAGIH
jgi:hypothetical protein